MRFLIPQDPRTSPKVFGVAASLNSPILGSLSREKARRLHWPSSSHRLRAGSRPVHSGIPPPGGREPGNARGDRTLRGSGTWKIVQPYLEALTVDS